MLKLQVHYFYYFIVLAIFLIITAPSLFSEGMFMDGLFYAAVSNNMAEGIGTFWKPYLAEYYYAEFFEHPPLALGLQSACFRIFGDSIYVERFYALACYLITGCLISLIWKELTGDTKTGWLPILLWMTVAIIPWACANNMLENTMSIFVCLSVLFYLKFNQNDHFSFLLLSAFSLSLALLTKGLVCLYVWALPFILWLVYRNMTFVKMTASTLLIVLFTLLPLIVLYLFYEPAANSISRYLNDQLFTSLEKIVTVDSRFHIVGEFLQNMYGWRPADYDQPKTKRFLYPDCLSFFCDSFSSNYSAHYKAIYLYGPRPHREKTKSCLYRYSTYTFHYSDKPSRKRC